MDLDNSAQIFNALSDVPGDVQDMDQLIEVRNLKIKLVSLVIHSLALWPSILNVKLYQYWLISEDNIVA